MSVFTTPRRKFPAASPALEAWRKRNPLARWMVRQGGLSGRGPGGKKVVPELAKKLGCSRQQIYNWIQGYSIPPLSRVAAITKATGITAQQWLAWLAKLPEE